MPTPNRNDCNALMEQNGALVPYALAPLLRRWEGLTDADKDDLFNAGRAGLWLAAERYKPGRGKFSTFAVSYIRGTAQKTLRRRILDLKAQRAGVSFVSLDAPLQMGGKSDGGPLAPLVDAMKSETAPDPASVAVNAQARAAFWEWARKHLTQRQARTFWLVYAEGGHGLGLRGAAERLGITYQAVSSAIRKGQAKLKQAAQSGDGGELFPLIFGR